MYKIAAMGDKDSIYGFASIGLEIFPADDAREATRLLRRLSEEKYAAVFLTESLAAQMGAELDRYRERAVPAVILIPGVSGNTGEGLRSISRSVEQAVGSDILK
ncbi:MAG: V-type ATP synthase subunit F [Clostridia bacterium]|nr:V-type ATP synthase subunit F [Clostridia bacterium]